MSDFEYLKNITLGQYLPLDSWIHKRNPGSKLAGYILLVAALSLTKSLMGLCFGLLAVFFYVLISKTPLKYAVRGLMAPLPFLIILAIIQLFMLPKESLSRPFFEILGFNIYYEGILTGGRLLIRFVDLLILLTTIGVTLSDLEMIHGLEILMRPLKKIGVKTDSAVMAAKITFRFIPSLAINAEKIAKSQASRGAEWGIKKGNLYKRIRQVFPLLIPLFNNSLRQAETLADAMLARGYGSSSIRTSLVDYHSDLSDWIFISSAFIFSALILYI